MPLPELQPTARQVAVQDTAFTCDQAIFPTGGSVLTGLMLAHRLAQQIPL